jgi:RNA polymerase sigma-70 factor, ECF subfamily
MQPEIFSYTKHDTSRSLLDRVCETKNEYDWRQFCDIYEPFLARQIELCGVDSGEIEDLVQESLTTIFQSIDAFQHNGRTGAFRKWLKSVVVHRVSRYFRRLQSRLATTSSQAVEHVSDRRWQNQLEQSWDREHDKYVVATVTKLIRPEFTESTWLAFEKQVFDHLAPLVVAEQLNISVNAALIAKSRVITRLRSICHQMID